MSCITASPPLEASSSQISEIRFAICTHPVMQGFSSGGLCRMSSSSCAPSCVGVSPTSRGATFSEARQRRNLSMGVIWSTTWVPDGVRHKAPITVGTMVTVPLEIGSLCSSEFEIVRRIASATLSSITCCKQLGSWWTNSVSRAAAFSKTFAPNDSLWTKT